MTNSGITLSRESQSGFVRRIRTLRSATPKQWCIRLKWAGGHTRAVLRFTMDASLSRPGCLRMSRYGPHESTPSSGRA
jgi:hypothetical protein